jgi:hypothetical protein
MAAEDKRDSYLRIFASTSIRWNKDIRTTLRAIFLHHGCRQEVEGPRYENFINFLNVKFGFILGL